MQILGWFENNQASDIPPEHIWDDSEGLEQWWERVKARRDAEYGLSSDDEIPDDDDMMGNDLARTFKSL